MKLTTTVDPLAVTPTPEPLFQFTVDIMDGLACVYTHTSTVDESTLCQAMIDATIMYEQLAGFDIIPVDISILADDIDAGDEVQQVLTASAADKFMESPEHVQMAISKGLILPDDTEEALTFVAKMRFSKRLTQYEADVIKQGIIGEAKS